MDRGVKLPLCVHRSPPPPSSGIPTVANASPRLAERAAFPRAYRPCPLVARAFRENYGPWDRLRATSAGPRGVRVGRNTIARQEGRGKVLAILEAGDRAAGELARDGPVDAVPGRSPRGGFSGFAGLALDPLLVPSQLTLGITAGLARDSAPSNPGSGCRGDAMLPFEPTRPVHCPALPALRRGVTAPLSKALTKVGSPPRRRLGTA